VGRHWAPSCLQPAARWGGGRPGSRSQCVHRRVRAHLHRDKGLAHAGGWSHHGCCSKPYGRAPATLRHEHARSVPAEVQWILRTDPYAPDREGDELQPEACSNASTAQLEARVEAGCATRKQARRALVRCAQAGLRVGWPELATARTDEVGTEHDSTQPTMERWRRRW
jgi:hypothetical protein